MRRAISLTILLFLLQSPAFAQECPGGVTKFIVGLAAGGGMDAMARLLAQSVTTQFKRTIVVENRTGASGNISAEYVARAPKDGCTITIRDNAHNVNPLIYSRAGYTQADFASVVMLMKGPGVIVASVNQPFKTLAAMVEYAKANPGKLSYGSSGIGSGNHLAAELFVRTAKIDLLHIPYKGAALAMQDLIGGQIALAVGSVASAMPYIESNKIIALAVTSPKRWPTLPDVPTLTEAGYPDATIVYWEGLLAPAGTPRPIIDKLNQEFTAAVNEPSVKAKLLTLGFEPAGGTPEELDAFIQEDNNRMRKLVPELKIKVE